MTEKEAERAVWRASDSKILSWELNDQSTANTVSSPTPAVPLTFNSSLPVSAVFPMGG